MKEYSIKITTQAYNQLLAIRDYIAEELFAPMAARNTMAALKTGIKSLATMPERVKLVDEEPWRRKGIRKLSIKKYYVYFRIDEEKDVIHVIAIIYASRNQMACLEELDTE